MSYIACLSGGGGIKEYAARELICIIKQDINKLISRITHRERESVMLDWAQAQTYSPNKESFIGTLDERNGSLLDNDETTLESERQRLNNVLKSIDNTLCITEQRRENKVDLFILNTSERTLFDKIGDYLKEHENSSQYSVASREIETTHEKAAYLKIKKYCFVIQRIPMALVNKKKYSPFNLLLLVGTILIAMYLVKLLYRIVQ